VSLITQPHAAQEKISLVRVEAQKCLRDIWEQTSLVLVCQESTAELLFTISDVLYVCVLINVYMWIKA